MSLCSDVANDPAFAWGCARGVGLGVVAVLTAIGCSFALFATTRVARMPGMPKLYLNRILLFLAFVQSVLDLVYHLAIMEPRLRFASMTCRAVQTNVLCAAHASFILQSRGTDERHMYAINSFLVIEILIVFILACTDDTSLSCEHPYWLIMSVSQLVVSLVFSGFGAKASQEMSKLETHLRTGFTSTRVVGSRDNEVSAKRKEIWVLMSVFLLASAADVSGDAWRVAAHRNGEGCATHATDGEEFARTVLDFLAFTAPVLTVFFVFYYQVSVIRYYSVHPTEEVDFDEARGVEMHENAASPRDVEGEEKTRSDSLDSRRAFEEYVGAKHSELNAAPSSTLENL